MTSTARVTRAFYAHLRELWIDIQEDIYDFGIPEPVESYPLYTADWRWVEEDEYAPF